MSEDFNTKFNCFFLDFKPKMKHDPQGGGKSKVLPDLIFSAEMLHKQDLP